MYRRPLRSRPTKENEAIPFRRDVLTFGASGHSVNPPIAGPD